MLSFTLQSQPSPVAIHVNPAAWALASIMRCFLSPIPALECNQWLIIVGIFVISSTSVDVINRSSSCTAVAAAILVHVIHNGIISGHWGGIAVTCV